jgi:hypothetical protein
MKKRLYSSVKLKLTRFPIFNYFFESCQILSITKIVFSWMVCGLWSQVKAAYKYQAEDVDELNFEVGEIIQVVEYDDPDEQVLDILFTNQRPPPALSTNERLSVIFCTNQRQTPALSTNKRLPTIFCTNQRTPPALFTK